MGFIKLRLDAITVDSEIQARADGTDEATVADYAALKKDGVPFPPAVVYYDGKKWWLSDGFHRHEADALNGQIMGEYEVRNGTRRDAVLHALGSNHGHGRRSSSADKRKAVLRMLADKEWAEWSDREIARRCGSTHPTVAKLRAELKDGAPVLTGKFTSETDTAQPAAGDSSLAQCSSETRTYLTKHGTTATMNVAKIGKAEEPPDVEQPDEDPVAEAPAEQPRTPAPTPLPGAPRRKSQPQDEPPDIMRDAEGYPVPKNLRDAFAGASEHLASEALDAKRRANEALKGYVSNPWIPARTREMLNRECQAHAEVYTNSRP